jgi:hypothetical protein
MEHTIHVEVLDEGSPTALKVPAELIGPGLYRLHTPPDYDPEDVKLRFLPGMVVRCVHERFADGSSGLIAIEEVKQGG